MFTKLRLIFVVISVFAMSLVTYGNTTSDSFVIEDYLGEFDDSLIDAIPQDSKEFLYEYGGNSIADIITLNPQEIIDYTITEFKEELTSPMKLLTTVVGVVILSVFAESLSGSYLSSSMGDLFSVITVLCCVGTVAVPVVELIKVATSAIVDYTNFIMALVPVMTGVMVASGQGSTATGYSMILFFACQLISVIARNFLIPFLGIYMGINIVSAVTTSEIKLEKIGQSIKKITTWSMGLVMSVLLGVLTINSLVGSGVDTMTAKTTKFLIGSFVPVVGSAISDAYMATRGYIGVVKSALGAFGIIVVVVIFLPILIRVVVWYITLNIASYISDILGSNKLSLMLSGFSAVVGIMLSLLLCLAILMVVSTAIVLMLGMGVM